MDHGYRHRLVLIGSAILYYHAIPSKQMPGVALWGPFIATFGDDAPSPDEDEWQQKTLEAYATAKRVSRLGFGFIAFGSLLQLIAVLATEG